MPAYLSPRSLEGRHELENFASRSSAQTQWLRKHARQAHATRSAHVMVVTARDPVGIAEDVVAYYAWTMASVTPSDLPERATRGVGCHPQPFTLLARLAVATEHEGRGLGHGLLRDAVIRNIDLSAKIGCRGLLIHAENDSARNFYLRALPGLEQSPTDPMHLIALGKDLARSVRL